MSAQPQTMAKLHCRPFPALPRGPHMATLASDTGHVPPASLLRWIPHLRMHFAECTLQNALCRMRFAQRHCFHRRASARANPGPRAWSAGAEMPLGVFDWLSLQLGLSDWLSLGHMLPSWLQGRLGRWGSRGFGGRLLSLEIARAKGLGSAQARPAPAQSCPSRSGRQLSGAGTAEGRGSRPAALVAAGPARLELHFPESFSRNGAELGLPQRGTSVRS